MSQEDSIWKAAGPAMSKSSDSEGGRGWGYGEEPALHQSGQMALSSGAVDTLTKRIKNKEDTMAYTDIIRVRKGKESRRRLTKEQPVVRPEHPAGLIALADAELDAV